MKPHHVKLVWIAVLLFITAACKDEQVITPPESNTIQGQFVSSDGSPLANILVEATDATGKMFSTFTTDAEGNFEIQNLPESNNNAIVSFINDNEVMQQLKLSTVVRLAGEDGAPSKSKKITIFLGGEYDYDASFAVIVVDKTTQERVQGAVVTMATSENAELSATSDADGEALFEKIVPGQYTISIYKDGYKIYKKDMLLVFPDGLDKFEFEFEITPADGTDPEECCNNLVKVKVTDVRGTPIPLETVFLHFDNRGYTFAYTDDNGIALFKDVCASAYEASVEYSAYGTSKKARATVRVACNDSIAIEMKLEKELPVCCKNTLIINLTDRNGKPFEHGLEIMVESADVEGSVSLNARTRTDTSSRAVFRNICKGDLMIKVKARVGNDPMLPITDFGAISTGEYDAKVQFTDCAQTIEVNVKMDMDAEKDKDPYCNNGAARLKFLKPNGEPWISHTIIRWTDMRGVQYYTTDANGEIFMYDLEEGYHEGQFVLPGCSTEQHKFDFSIKCNESIKKEYIITCE